MPKYLVETISVFRMRYVVEANNASDAKDEVTMNNDGQLHEFSQLHIDELITSTREIDRAEYLRMFDEDNDYLQSWDEEYTVMMRKKSSRLVLSYKSFPKIF
ncbi:hypothetical protein EBV26_09040 [bacterium]|nr:hypothetical protein [bacterium]